MWIKLFFLSMLTQPAFAQNHAGCDVIGGSCTDYGKCCDWHDEGIGAHCPPGCRSVADLMWPLWGNRCKDRANPMWTGWDYDACHQDHADVKTCIAACNDTDGDGEPDGAACPRAPSDCCNEAHPELDYCGLPQVCFDDANNRPIYDACECERVLQGDFGCTCENGSASEGDSCGPFCPCTDGTSCVNGTCADPAPAPSPSPTPAP